jgi:hypothetical protein
MKFRGDILCCLAPLNQELLNKMAIVFNKKDFNTTKCRCGLKYNVYSSELTGHQKSRWSI